MEKFNFIMGDVSYFNDDIKELIGGLGKYVDFMEIIKEDFERALILLEDKKNNKELIDEFDKVINNITRFYEYIKNDDVFAVELSDEFLYLDYGMLKEETNRVSIIPCTVIVNRNYREFYFIRDNLVHKFNVKENEVESKKYNIERNINSSDEESIKKFILSLNEN